MKKFLKNSCIAIAALLGLTTFAQTATKNAAKTKTEKKEATQVAAQRNESGSGAKSLLWKITGNGLSAPSYLYGTIHITCDATLDQSTLAALNNTAQLYLELDMDDPNLQMAMMQGIMMSGGKTMQSMVSPADFKLLDEFLQKKLKMGAAAFNTVKPAMISTLLLPMLIDCPMQSVEQELLKINAGNNKETFGLEEVKEQLAVFDAIPYQVQMDELMKAVKADFGESKKELEQMYALYKTKDVDALQKLTEESDNKMTADFQNVLLDDRNANWIPKIENVAKSKPTFFAVGAAHLGGPKGVIALLRTRGYTVEPVLN